MRTDAVWEKQKLTDWFRLFYKNFYFLADEKKYVYIPPSYLVHYLRYFDSLFSTAVDYLGYTPTGRTVG